MAWQTKDGKECLFFTDAVDSSCSWESPAGSEKIGCKPPCIEESGNLNSGSGYYQQDNFDCVRLTSAVGSIGGDTFKQARAAVPATHASAVLTCLLTARACSRAYSCSSWSTPTRR